MPHACLDDVDLFYTDDGDGPAVLLVHGLGADSHDWSWQIPELAVRHRTISVDLRGHGASSVPVEGYTVRDHVRDLVGLLDVLGIDDTVVAGHSLGGLIVAELAITQPHRVTAVVEVDPAYGFDPAWPVGFRAVAAAIDELGPEAALAAMEAFWVATTPPHLRCWHRRRVQAMPAHVLSQSMTAWADSPGTALGPASVAYLSLRCCPVLAVYADASRVEWERSTMTSPLSRAVAFDDVGHWLHQERPSEFTDLVLEWTVSLADGSAGAAACRR
jgi:pimeloyl-ACP methyl ester carboxylesterase